MSNKEILFTPFKIGNIEVPNRFVETAVTGTSIFDKGVFNEATRDFYLARARGGAGLIVSGAVAVMDNFGRGYNVNQYEKEFDGPVKELMELIHEAGAKFFLQINAGLGRVVGLKAFDYMSDSDFNKVRFASSQLPNVWDPSVIHEEMPQKEIRRRIQLAIWAAAKAKECGIDGVEIHAVHEGYLLDQFAIANTNFRDDCYGGTLENRLRFATDIIRGIKEECGDYPVAVRYSVVSKMKGFNRGALPEEEYEEFGRDYQESIRAAKILEEAGCDMLDADNGSYDAWYWAHPPVYMKKACNLEDCAFLRRHVSIPVVCAGRMDDPQVAAEAINKGQIDGIGIARQFLADAEWVSKLRQGHAEQIRPCIACHNGCLGRLVEGEGLSCALNPACMQERKYAVTAAEQKRNVLVAGGGIAGMEAARVCAMRGHKVMLCEKSDRLGGAFIAAAAPSFKEDDKRLIEWYIGEMQRKQVEVRLNTAVDAALVKELRPDDVIVANGAMPRQLPVKGIDKKHVVEAKSWLLGKEKAGKRVVIIGGGLTGCEVAYEMALHGHEVTVVEMLDDILQVKNLCAANSIMLRELMEQKNVQVITHANLSEVRDEGVLISKGGKEIKLTCDTVILAVGYTASPLEIPKETQYNIHIIGDAKASGNILNAVWSAYDVALRI